MSAELEVVSAGALASVQDLGRVGSRRLGVPRAGALDPVALRIANALAGNDAGHAGIEFFVAGPTLRAHGAPVVVGCAGDFSVTLVRDGASAALESWRSVTLLPGDTLRLGQPTAGRVGCIAVQGLSVANVLGSASTYARAAMGGVAGRPLAAGDRLVAAAAAADAPLRTLPPRARPARTTPLRIRVVLGPQDDHFDAAALAVFLDGEYRVSSDADRMGVRLEGPVLAHRADKGAEIVSDATVPGSVQVPGSGLPIVLLADGQTVGGYPKIATVVTADLPALATAAVGTTVRFEAVSVDAAVAQAREHEAETLGRIAAITLLNVHDGVDLQAIYASNLVSGMIDALE